ncbi:MAG TPA: family 16 glycoside hydrolase [Dehalococcoidia bacterium]|nr:family 16 glycoside hydrolase [Dehalococcoidia bacterium]
MYTVRFAEGPAGWLNEPEGPARWAEGAYRLTSQEPGRFVALDAPLAEPLGDVIVRARFRKLGGPPGGGYGLILRGQTYGARDGRAQDGRYYVLEAGDRGEVGIWRRDGDRWVDLVPWTAAAAVRPGGEPNEVEAEARGDRLTLRVNGQVVAEATDAALGPGAVGVFVGGDLNDVAVDHFSVVALE